MDDNVNNTEKYLKYKNELNRQKREKERLNKHSNPNNAVEQAKTIAKKKVKKAIIKKYITTAAITTACAPFPCLIPALIFLVLIVVVGFIKTYCSDVSEAGVCLETVTTFFGSFSADFFGFIWKALF